MSEKVFIGKITQIKENYGYILEAEPMYKITEKFVGRTFRFNLTKIGFDFENTEDDFDIHEELKNRSIEVGTTVRFALDKARVTRVFPLTFRE